MKGEANTSEVAEPHLEGRAPEFARFFLARQGRTALPVVGALRGHLESPCEALGRQQGEWLAVTLGHRAARHVVARPPHRAVESAQAVATWAHVGVEIDPRLTDRDYGPWGGQPKVAVKAPWSSLDSAPGGEPTAEVRGGPRGTLAHVARQPQGEVAAVVSLEASNLLTLAILRPGLRDPDALSPAMGVLQDLGSARRAQDCASRQRGR